MKYLSIENYPKAWIFRHQEMPVPAEDLQQIKPLTTQRAENIWAEYISRESTHPEHFAGDDWAADENAWSGSDIWQSAWDRAENKLPELMDEHLAAWQDDTTIFFCYESEHILETKWRIFRLYWKNFLFFDNGPVLLGRKRGEVVQFFDNGQFRVGKRPL